MVYKKTSDGIWEGENGKLYKKNPATHGTGLDNELKEKLIHHPVFSKYSTYDHELAKYFKSNKFTPEEYIKLHQLQYHDKYGQDSPLESFGHDIWENHKYNTPENNKEILKHHVKNNNPNGIRQIFEKLKLSDSDITNIINNPDKYHIGEGYGAPKFSSLVDQPNLKKQHIYRIAEKHPDQLSNFIKHPEFEDKFINNIINDPTAIANMYATHMDDIVNKDLNPQQVDKLLENGDEHLQDNQLHKLLDKLPEDKRDKYIEDKLGITGGRHANKIENLYDNPESEEDKNKFNKEDNWHNWTSGLNGDKKIATKLASYGKLKENHIDHIKRHGDFNSKYNLYNNPHIDPKHGVEMFEKWYNNDSEHDYDQSELNEKLQEDYEDDVRDKFYDEAREEVENKNPMSDFITDYGKEYVDDEDVTNKYNNEIQNELDQHDWIGENPDHDPNNPESQPTINYADHPNYTINEHPDFDERHQEAIDKYKEVYLENETPDSLYEAYDESNSDEIDNKMYDLTNQHFEKAHENEDYIPEHLKEHIPVLEEIKKQKRQKEEEKARQEAVEKEKKLSGFLNEKMPIRMNEHQYSEGLHHHEMVKDYADANRGSIDIGTMHKIFPNLKDTWKNIFGDKGKLTSEEIQSKIDSIPKTKYNISYDKWDGNQMQNINGQDQVVVRLDHSPESQEELKKDPEVYGTFKKIQEVSKRSGHPTNNNSIAWARIDTSDPKNWMQDEVQSDFSSAARKYLEENGATEKAAHVQKIIDLHKDWRENLMNAVIKLAKQNGVEKIATHTPESKAQHTGASREHSVYNDSYQKIPRKMGFKPTTMENLPLSEKGKEIFQTIGGGKPTEDAQERSNKHLEAYQHHKQMIASHRKAQSEYGPSKPQDQDYLIHNDFIEHHKGFAQRHKQVALDIDPTAAVKFHNVDANSNLDEESTGNLGKKAVQNNTFTSHPYDSEINKPVVQTTPKGANVGHILHLQPQFFRKNIGLANDLIKIETLYVIAKENQYDTSKILDLIKNIRYSIKYGTLN